MLVSEIRHPAQEENIGKGRDERWGSGAEEEGSESR